MNPMRKAQAEWFLTEAKRWRKAAVDWEWACVHATRPGDAARFTQRYLHCERWARQCEVQAEVLR
jgi:hypothetical protein